MVFVFLFYEIKKIKNSCFFPSINLNVNRVSYDFTLTTMNWSQWIWIPWQSHPPMTFHTTNILCISHCDWFVKHKRLHVTSLSSLENSLAKASTLENSSGSPPHTNSSGSTPTSWNGVTAEASANPSSSKEHRGLPIIVPLIPPPLIKAPAGKKHKHAFE